MQSNTLPATRRKLTPPQYARELGTDTAKVLSWIKSGELPAMNAARHPGGRPRDLIDRADIAIFEQRRSVTPPPARAVRRKRRLPEGFVKYF